MSTPVETLEFQAEARQLLQLMVHSIYSEKDIFLSGLGFVLRLAPGAVIGPYASIGLGAAYIRPKADNFVDKQETLMALGAGGGLEITFKKQITLRLDARNWSIFDQNEATNYQEYSGGLAIFF